MVVSYILRRLLLLFPTLLGMTFVVFMVMALSPGGIGGSLLNEVGEMDSQQGKRIKEYYQRRYRTDLPLIQQYLWWLNQVSPIGFDVKIDDRGAAHLGTFHLLKKPNLGESMAKGRPVLDLFAEALPVTLTLNLMTVPLIYGLVIPLGLYSARHRGKLLDLGVGVGTLALWSLPTIMVGVMLVGFLANRDHWYWFPTGGISSPDATHMTFLPSFPAGGFERGWLLDRLWHLVLPVTCLLYGSFAVLTKLMRASVLENMSADFVRTARAKGLDDRNVLWRHVFRTSLLPLITVLAGVLPSLLGGSVVIESIFSLPGMGKLAIEAAFSRDRELILASALVSGLLGLICILIADLMYTVADPRVSYE